MQVKGNIKLINETQTFDSGFQKREFVVTTNDMYPQDIKIEMKRVFKIGLGRVVFIKPERYLLVLPGTLWGEADRFLPLFLMSERGYLYFLKPAAININLYPVTCWLVFMVNHTNQ